MAPEDLFRGMGGRWTWCIPGDNAIRVETKIFFYNLRENAKMCKMSLILAKFCEQFYFLKNYQSISMFTTFLQKSPYCFPFREHFHENNYNLYKKADCLKLPRELLLFCTYFRENFREKKY